MILIRYVRNLFFSKSHIKLIAYFIILSLFATEVLVYYFATFWWHKIECSRKSECTRILLVADPQLIGVHNEHINVLTPLSIWDSDRYLLKTFSHVLHHAKPDVVIFLGDLFDEGSSGTNDEFKSYVKRLFSIFLNRSYDGIRHIWLPGDNDIGGEGSERITKENIGRFEHAFSQPDIIQTKYVKFYKINRLLSLIPKFREKYQFNDLASVRVGLSHLPLMMSPAVFVDKVLDKLRPHLLFTAHTHKSMIITTPDEFRNDRLITPVRAYDNKVYEYTLGLTDFYEILVPTCSYRMGTDEIGYGFAVIEREMLNYTVLWSPSRFPQLVFYGLMVVSVFMYYVIRIIYYKCCKQRQYSELSSTANDQDFPS